MDLADPSFLLNKLKPSKIMRIGLNRMAFIFHKSKKRTKNNKCKNTTVLFTTPVSKILEGFFENVGITGLKKTENKYTGKNLVGIAIMHKSNMVPVFSQNSAVEISQMRR